LSLWYDGADASTVQLTSGKVSQWANKASASFNITQANTSQQPTYSPGRGLVFSSASATVLSNATPPTYTTAVNSYCVFTANNGTRMRLLKVFGNTNVGSVLDTTIPSMFLPTAAFFYNAFSITSSVRYAQSQNIYSSSARGFSLNFSEVTNLTQDGAGSSQSLLFVGGEATVYFDGIIHEIVVINGFLTVSQRQQMEGYLAWKWGLVGNLPSNHPFKLWPPSP
jgi:hypothetical protein